MPSSKARSTTGWSSARPSATNRTALRAAARTHVRLGVAVPMAKGYGLAPRALFSQLWFRDLSDRAKCLALYVALGPHSNIIGAYLLPDPYISADLNWPIDVVQATLSELVRCGFVRRFGDGLYILLCRHRDWNTIANPNVM